MVRAFLSEVMGFCFIFSFSFLQQRNKCPNFNVMIYSVFYPAGKIH